MEGTTTSAGFIGVHIGAGNHSNSKLGEYEKVCKKACSKAIEAIRLKKSALEALSIAIKILEDCPLTNAGTGSNLSLAATVECDASIMDGQMSNFGAVAAVKGIQNPIMVAKKLITEQSIPLPSGRVPPIFLCCEGAHDWAVNHGIPGVSEKSLITEKALRSFKKYTKFTKGKEDTGVERKDDEVADGRASKRLRVQDQELPDSSCMTRDLLDTVGAVCLDGYGNVCSGVSSGGLLLKYPGRIGQAAVYGSGCWASNISQDSPVGVACCSSGCGEQLIKTLLCKECADLCFDRKLVDGDGIAVLQELLQTKFLDSPRLSTTAGEKLAGIILLRSHIDDLSKESKELEVEFTWGHTTQTMAVGYMSIEDQKPKFQLTTLEPNCNPGSSILVQGVVKTQRLRVCSGETNIKQTS